MSRYWITRYDEQLELFQTCEKCGTLIPDNFWGKENSKQIHDDWHDSVERT